MKKVIYLLALCMALGLSGCENLQKEDNGIKFRFVADSFLMNCLLFGKK